MMTSVRTVLSTAALLSVASLALTVASPAAAQPVGPTATESATGTPTEPVPATSEPAQGAAAAGRAAPGQSLAGGVAAGLADRALDSLFESIGEAAIWAFGKVLSWIDETSSPDVTQRWFGQTYARTYWLAATIALAALVWAITVAALRNGVTGVVGVLPRVLYVAVGLAVAVPLVQTLLEFTDWLSAQVAGQTSQNLSEMAGTLGRVLVGGTGVAAVAARTGGIPAMVVGFLALVILVGALVVWLELIFRSAAIYLLLAAAAFPAALSINRASATPIRKVAAWIVALAFAKPVIVLAFWVGSAPFASDGEAGVASVLTGAGTMTTAVFAPWALFRLFDFAGDQMTAAFAASATPQKLRTHVEQPVTTYRRTATAVRERSATLRERGASAFSPHRTRGASAAAPGTGGAATGGALVLAGVATAGAAASKRAVRGMAATEPARPTTRGAGTAPTHDLAVVDSGAEPQPGAALPVRPLRTGEARSTRGGRPEPRAAFELPQRASPSSRADGGGSAHLPVPAGPSPAAPATVRPRPPTPGPVRWGPAPRPGAAPAAQRPRPDAGPPEASRLPQRRARPPVDPRGDTR